MLPKNLHFFAFFCNDSTFLHVAYVLGSFYDQPSKYSLIDELREFVEILIDGISDC